MSGHVLRFPRPTSGDLASFVSFVRRELQARADARLSAVPDHVLGPATDASDAAIDHALRQQSARIADVARIVAALVDQLEVR